MTSSQRVDRVYIEITNLCNFQCSFCPEVQRPKNVMAVQDFEDVLNQVKPFTKEITLHLMGEPLSHPKFDEILNICERLQVPVQLTTNGTLLLVKGRDRAVLNPTVRQINFSIQSLFDNWGWDRAVRTTKDILGFCAQAMALRPDLFLNLRLWNVGADSDSGPMSREWECLTMLLQDQFGYEESKNENIDLRAGKKSIRIQDRLYLHMDSRFQWPSLAAEAIRQQGFCYALKNHFGVLSDGTVVPCCLDKEAAIPLGKILGEGRVSLGEILQSPRATRLRRGFDNFHLSEELCRRCTFIDRFDGRVQKASRPVRKGNVTLKP